MAWLKKSFLRDSDGLSAKDYLMLVFTTPYILAWSAVMALAVAGWTIAPIVIEVMRLLDGAVMTIVGGWFGVQVVQEIASKRNRGSLITESTDEQGHTDNELGLP